MIYQSPTGEEPLDRAKARLGCVGGHRVRVASDPDDGYGAHGGTYGVVGEVGNNAVCEQIALTAPSTIGRGNTRYGFEGEDDDRGTGATTENGVWGQNRM